MAALNFPLSFLGTVTVGSQLMFVSTECTRLKKRYVGIGSLKVMFIPCINIVYGSICLKNFLIIDNEAHY